jgi:hypothetical protein
MTLLAHPCIISHVLSLYLLISEVILVCHLFCSSQSVSSCHIHKKEEEAKNKCDVSVPVCHIISFFAPTILFSSSYVSSWHKMQTHLINFPCCSLSIISCLIIIMVCQQNK